MGAGRADNSLCCPRALVYFPVGIIVVTMLCLTALHSLQSIHIPGFTQFWPNQERCRCISERDVTERETEDAEWEVIHLCSYSFSELKIKQVFLTQMSNVFPAHFTVTGNA